jgi:hypothetical protein
LPCELRGKLCGEADQSSFLWRERCDLRRTGIRNLVRAGVPDSVAMKISGHKTRAVFERYNVTSERDLDEAARKVKSYMDELSKRQVKEQPPVALAPVAVEQLVQ